MSEHELQHELLKKEIIDVVDEKLDKFDGKLDSKFKVTVKNGTVKERDIREVVIDIHNDISILRDLNKVHSAFKRLKVYWIVSGLVIILVGFHKHIPLIDIISNLIK